MFYKDPPRTYAEDNLEAGGFQARTDADLKEAISSNFRYYNPLLSPSPPPRAPVTSGCHMTLHAPKVCADTSPRGTRQETNVQKKTDWRTCPLQAGVQSIFWPHCSVGADMSGGVCLPASPLGDFSMSHDGPGVEWEQGCYGETLSR